MRKHNSFSQISIAYLHAISFHRSVNQTGLKKSIKSVIQIE